MARAAQEGLAEASLSGSTLVSAGKGTMSVNYTGPLGGFLDVVGDAFNYGWEYDGNRIVFPSRHGGRSSSRRSGPD